MVAAPVASADDVGGDMQRILDRFLGDSNMAWSRSRLKSFKKDEVVGDMNPGLSRGMVTAGVAEDRRDEGL